MMRNVMIHGLLVAVLVGLSGCQTLTDVGADIGEASGTLTPEEAAAIRRTLAVLSRRRFLRAMRH
jgi:predicted small secreted protein